MLWPYLLETLVPEQYSNSVGAVCRSLAHLAQKKREENAEDYEICLLYTSDAADD